MGQSSPFDIVIVGAGPAGCVLANRLTEDAGRTVALLEAGPDYGPDPTAWPADLRDAAGIRPDSHSWGYSHAERALDHPVALPRAKVVGGSSTVNACLWLRGSAADYDEWAALGNSGWSFADLLPYFRRVESDPLGGPLHGRVGPVPVSRAARAELSLVDRAFVESAEELGFTYVADFNGAPEQSPGVGPIPKNVVDAVRMNAAFAYLTPARQRPNLTVVPDAHVDRVQIEGGRATGVRTADGRVVLGHEVILCAGAYGSPAVLLRSGVGPAAELQELGIPVVANRPGVGANLLDHPFLSFREHEDVPAYHIEPGCSPGGPTFIPVLLKGRSARTTDEINYHVYTGQHLDDGRWVFWLTLSLESSRSQGCVRLTSTDPGATLDIDHRYFADPADLEAMCDGVERLSWLLATPPLSTTIRPVPGQTPRWADRGELRAWVRKRVRTTFHPSSTCRMGSIDDPGAVVDAAGRVHDVPGLRVVDASIFPTGPRANLHCTTLAVAEKLADTIRAEITP